MAGGPGAWRAEQVRGGRSGQSGRVVGRAGAWQAEQVEQERGRRSRCVAGGAGAWQLEQARGGRSRRVAGGAGGWQAGGTLRPERPASSLRPRLLITQLPQCKPQEKPLFLRKGWRRRVLGTEEFGGSTRFLSFFSLLSLAPPQGQPQLPGGISTAVMVVAGTRGPKMQAKTLLAGLGAEELRTGPRGPEGVGACPPPSRFAQQACGGTELCDCTGGGS